MPRCGIVILAAGASVRMGTAKQLLMFEGSTLLARAVQTAIKSKCRPVVVVLGSRAAELRPLVENQQIQIVINPDWELGMGTSIRTGVASLRETSVDAALLFLCDQPLVTASHLNQMVDAHFASGKTISAASYAGTFGTPVIFAESLFEELAALQDAQGGKAVVSRHVDQTKMFQLPEARIDVDTPAEFEKLSQWDG